ncbi:MAG: response regulator [Anaerolineales bacterium]|jgi:adenylate cyclase|nr:response regulator [Anaerolineales bacterium]
MSTILVVDDHPVNQRLLQYRLTSIGHSVLIANNGLQALKILNEPSNQTIDLAIVDIAMPEMDGLTLLHQLRSSPQFQTLPIVMLTASGQETDRQIAKAEGANAFLTKPVSSWELTETIRRYLPAA